MRILIAPDKFKGTLRGEEAAAAIARGLRMAAARPEIATQLKTKFGSDQLEIECRPLADGGEGSHDCLRTLLATERTLPGQPDLENTLPLPDACGRPVQVHWLATRKNTQPQQHDYYLETARVIGLIMPGARDVSILDRSTEGVGVWLAAMLAGTPSHSRINLHLFLGGSATSDGGCGLARSLGFRFERADGTEVLRFREIQSAVRVIPPPKRSEQEIHCQVYTDVQNPLTGADGAARLFGPQKGATAAEVQQLEDALAHLAKLYAAAAGENENKRCDTPGVGAAGGLALPLLYWPGVRCEFHSGIDFFIETAGIARLLNEWQPHWLISGEGRTDRGSLQGKAISGLARALASNTDSRNAKVPLWILSGSIPAEDRKALAAAGFAHLLDTNQVCGELNADEVQALDPPRARQRLEQTSARALELFCGAS